MTTAQVSKQHHMFPPCAVPASGVPMVCEVRSLTLALYIYLPPATSSEPYNNLRTTGKFGRCVLLS